MNTTNNEAIGKLSNGENVFMRRTGKNSYQYVDGNGNKVDGRKVKKFSTKPKPPVKQNVIIKEKKATPKPVIKKNVIIKKKKTTPKPFSVLNEENKWVDGYLKKPTHLTGEWVKVKEGLADGKFRNIYVKKKGEFWDPDYGDWFDMDEVDKQYWDKFYEDKQKEEDAPQKLADEIAEKEKAEKEKARLKKTTPKPTQGKQTTDQLEKRRLKYQENREKELARKRAYREANKEKINAKQDAYRETGKSKAYQKAYRDENAKIYEPKRTKKEMEAGVKAYGLGKGELRYKKDIDELIKKDDTTPRKVRNDAGNKRGEYKKKEKKKLVKYPSPSKKSGESDEVFRTRLGLWDLVRKGKLPPSNLTMRKAILITYGDGIRSGGKDITTGEWIKSKEKAGRNIERDGLGVGNLLTAENDPDEVF